MKPIEVEFASRGPALLWIWGLAGSVCLGALAATASIVARQQERLAHVQQEIHTLREQRPRDAAMRRTGPAETADTASRGAALLPGARHLQLDLNPAFSAVERVDVPGAQLMQMVLEPREGSGAAHGIRLEYLLDSMEKVPAVTATLNGGEGPDWRLESAGTGNGGVRGAWRFVGR